ncbi:MAG: hypothetical protein ACI8QD_002685 [Cyclobacteriaceae bacterium]
MYLEDRHQILDQAGFKITDRAGQMELWTNDSGVICCIAIQEYVSIEAFKTTFQTILSIASKANFHTLIFDKRALTTFHQPTMEWYYVDWKVSAAELGIVNHFKILPPMEWFQKAVAIAKEGLDAQLKEKTGDRVVIRYTGTLKEGISKCILV